MQNGDEASPSIILAGRALLVKMLITLEPHGIFGSKFVYYYIIFLTGNIRLAGGYSKQKRKYPRSRSFFELGQRSFTYEN